MKGFSLRTCRALVLQVASASLLFFGLTSAAYAAPIDIYRQQFVNDFNQGRYIYSAMPDGEVAMFTFDSTLGSSYQAKFGESATFGLAVFAITKNPYAAVGAGVAYGGVSLALNRAQGTWSGDPFIADVILGKSLFIAGEGDVTAKLISAGKSDIVRTDLLRDRNGELNGSRIEFIEPSLFNVQLRDSSKNQVSQLFGTDAFLWESDADTLFGYIAYNDPSVTGRAVAPTDTFHVDYSTITSLPPDTPVELIATHMVVTDLVVPPVPEPCTLLLLGSGLTWLAWYGRKRNAL